MYYEINVALYGKHLFATSDRSIVDKDKLKAVLAIIRAKFPVNEGYEVTAYRYFKTGEVVTDI